MKRLFFGYEIKTKWPNEAFEKQDTRCHRILRHDMRHITTCFVGTIEEKIFSQYLDAWKQNTPAIAPCGIFRKLTLLPPRKKHCLALEVAFGARQQDFIALQQQLYHHFGPILPKTLPHFDDPLPHITLARAPFCFSLWKKLYTPLLPMAFTVTHHTLFISEGSLTYIPIIRTPFLLPFEAFDHTADMGWTIRGASLQEMAYNSLLAITSLDPKIFLASEKKEAPIFEELTDVIDWLNDLIAATDIEHGCGIKAVSHHGSILDVKQILEWKMIIDI